MMFMKKGILLFAVSIILCGSVGAQDSVRTFRNAITVNPLPLMGGGLLMAYEHTLPHAGIEIDAGVQGWQWEKHHDVPMNVHMRPGFAVAAGYKYFLPLGKKNRELTTDGCLPRESFYLKMRLAYMRQWSSYNTYVGNDGWDIHTLKRTFHEQSIHCALILGVQLVTKNGLTLSPYFGVNIPLWIGGPFHTIQEPGLSVINFALLTTGFKVGWAF